MTTILENFSSNFSFIPAGSALYTAGPNSSSYAITIMPIQERLNKLKLQPEFMRYLTATKGTHFSILGVNLANVCNTFTQDIYRNFIAVLVLPVCSFITSTLNLGTSISYDRKINILNINLFEQK